MNGGASVINGVGGDSLNSIFIGFTLGYEISPNLFLTAGYSTSIDDGDPGDLEMDVFRLSLVYGWHQLVTGMERLMEGG